MGRKVEGSPKLRALGGTHSRSWRDRVGGGAEMGEIVLAKGAGVTREKDRGHGERRVGVVKEEATYPASSCSGRRTRKQGGR